MKLIRLSSNKSSFHDVVFNPSGISIIVGKKQDAAINNSQKTYNGVGKSLIIEIIHFCLASDSIEAFYKLTDWEFTLEFEINGEKYISSRKTNDQKIIVLNDKEYTCDQFRKLFQKELFYIDEKFNFLTYRSLLSRFIRRGKKNYISYATYNFKETDYSKLLNNSYLLGLDINTIKYKHDLKKEFDDIEKMQKNIERDSVLRKFLMNNKIDIDITDLEEKIKDLSLKINNFEIAEDYKIIQDEADEITAQLKRLDNNITVYKNAIKNINQSINLKPDISKEKILTLLDEAKLVMPELIIKRLSDVESFHNNLLNNRVKRLLSEKKKLEYMIDSLLSTRKYFENDLNSKLKYLNKRGALEEYTALSEKLSDLKIKLSNLKRYEEIIENYKTKISEIKIKFEQENINANKYLKEAKSTVEQNIKIFRDLSRNFYEDKPGGIEISNNEGINQTRFNISVQLQDDSSDGVNEVKLFCFDFTILQAKYNHNMDFIFHDSRILANMDPRQRATLFKLAHEQAKNLGLQYIISANQDSLDSIRNEIPEEYENIIGNNIILELTDSSAESKLLGINIDLKYEDET